MAKDSAARYKDLPLKMVGGTHFGRYSKISNEQTFNMIISDGFNVPFAGYQMKIPIDQNGEGRAIASSTLQNKMFAVINSSFYSINSSLGAQQGIGMLATSAVDNCFISENNARTILVSDTEFLYTYNTTTNVLAQIPGIKSVIKNPGYITFQNGRFIVPDLSTNLWYISNLNGTPVGGVNPVTFQATSQFQGALQTKPDTCQACVRFPGKGNLLLVMGNIVTEQWQDVGAQLFPYQRTAYSNIDYGCLNPASIDQNEDIVCWVAGNEKSGSFIAYSDGGSIKRISNDGIDFKLANLTDPTNVYGYLFRQDGHLIYAAVWPGDNLSYAYDFNTSEFVTLSSEKMGAYIAKDVVYFNGKYYFVSIIDGNIYEMGSNLYTYDYGNGNVAEIPRIRIPPPIRLPDQSRFITGYMGFTIEQGQFSYDYRDTRSLLSDEIGDPITTQGDQPYLVPIGGNNYSSNGARQYIGNGYNFRTNVPRVDLALSKDGAVNFGSNVSINMRPEGKRQNRLMWWRLGGSNDLTPQFRFWGLDRFVMTDGIAGIYQ
jgi:hypothetical protein